MPDSSPLHQWECQSRGGPHQWGSDQTVGDVDLGLWKSLCGVSWLTLFCLSPLELCHMSCQLHWSLTNALTQQVSGFTSEISVKYFLVSYSSLSTCFVVVKNVIQQRIMRDSVGYSLATDGKEQMYKKSFYFQVTSVLVQTVCWGIPKMCSQSCSEECLCCLSCLEMWHPLVLKPIWSK